VLDLQFSRSTEAGAESRPAVESSEPTSEGSGIGVSVSVSIGSDGGTPDAEATADAGIATPAAPVDPNKSEFRISGETPAPSAIENTGDLAAGGLQRLVVMRVRVQSRRRRNVES